MSREKIRQQAFQRQQQQANIARQQRQMQRKIAGHKSAIAGGRTIDNKVEATFPDGGKANAELTFSASYQPGGTYPVSQTASGKTYLHNRSHIEPVPDDYEAQPEATYPIKWMALTYDETNLNVWIGGTEEEPDLVLQLPYDPSNYQISTIYDGMTSEPPPEAVYMFNLQSTGPEKDDWILTYGIQDNFNSPVSYQTSEFGYSNSYAYRVRFYEKSVDGGTNLIVQKDNPQNILWEWQIYNGSAGALMGPSESYSYFICGAGKILETYSALTSNTSFYAGPYFGADEFGIPYAATISEINGSYQYTILSDDGSFTSTVAYSAYTAVSIFNTSTTTFGVDQTVTSSGQFPTLTGLYTDTTSNFYQYINVHSGYNENILTYSGLYVEPQGIFINQSNTKSYVSLTNYSIIPFKRVSTIFDSSGMLIPSIEYPSGTRKTFSFSAYDTFTDNSIYSFLSDHRSEIVDTSTDPLTIDDILVYDIDGDAFLIDDSQDVYKFVVPDGETLIEIAQISYAGE